MTVNSAFLRIDFKIIFIFIAIISAIIFSGCVQPDGDTGVGIADPGFIGEIVDSLYFPELIDTYYSTQISTGGVQTLYLGEWENFQSKFLIKFTTFSTLPDSYSIDSANIRLRTKSFLGDSTETYGDFNYSVHEVLEVLPNNDWFESNVTWDSVLAWDPSPIFESMISQGPDSDSVAFAVPVELVDSWILAEQPADTSGGDSTEIPNLGLIFDYSGNPQFMREFFSSENSDSTLKPTLVLTITTSDSAWLSSSGIDTNFTGSDTTLDLNVYASNDVYICRDTEILDQSRMFLGRGQADRCMYWFDASELFPVFGYFIHKAEFTIFFDSEHPQAVGEYVSLSVSKLNDDAWMTDSTDVNFSTLYSLSSSIVGDSVVLDITPYLRTWVAYPDSNFGLLNRFGNETNTMARLPVYSFDNAPADKKPYLRVISSRREE